MSLNPRRAQIIGTDAGNIHFVIRARCRARMREESPGRCAPRIPRCAHAAHATRDYLIPRRKSCSLLNNLDDPRGIIIVPRGGLSLRVQQVQQVEKHGSSPWICGRSLSLSPLVAPAGYEMKRNSSVFARDSLGGKFKYNAYALR